MLMPVGGRGAPPAAAKVADLAGDLADRRCAQLAADAARLLGAGDAEIAAVRRAALLHEFGTTAVPNSIWDKHGPLTRAEFDRVELHTMLSEQMLRRSPALAALGPVAAAHHEKADGSGYHRGLHGDATERGARICPPRTSTSG